MSVFCLPLTQNHCTVKRLLAKQGPSKRQTPGERPPYPPLGEWLKCQPQKSVMFGDRKLGHMLKIKTLGHRLGEHRVRTEKISREQPDNSKFIDYRNLQNFNS